MKSWLTVTKYSSFSELFSLKNRLMKSVDWKADISAENGTFRCWRFSGHILEGIGASWCWSYVSIAHFFLSFLMSFTSIVSSLYRRCRQFPDEKLKIVKDNMCLLHQLLTEEIKSRIVLHRLLINFFFCSFLELMTSSLAQDRTHLNLIQTIKQHTAIRSAGLSFQNPKGHNV